MHGSRPFLKTSVSNTPILIHRGSLRLETLEVQNDNTAQEFLQIFDWTTASEIKVNVTFTANSGTDVFTAAAHGMRNGTRLKVFNTGGALPTGLAVDTNYWVVNATTNTFQLAATAAGTPIDISDAGSGTNTFTTYLKQSFIIPAGDGTNSGAVSKEWPDGMELYDGMIVVVTTTRTGSTAPVLPSCVQGTFF